MKILVTGAAGFIGMHTSIKLLDRGDDVIGVDNLNDYYDVDLKKSRLANLQTYPNFQFVNTSIENRASMKQIFDNSNIKYVIHLAAQAGVRYSLANPDAYIESNIQGFMNILELCRHHSVKHLTYASSSSVYGLNKTQPFNENQKTDFPTSLYGATKKSNEILAHSYSYIYNLPCTGLRFFTVYGPYGRPDMSLFLFAEAIFKKTKLKLFNRGNMRRSFTHIDDIVNGIEKIILKIPRYNKEKNITKENVPYQIYNLGNPKDESLKNYLKYIENASKNKTTVAKMDMQIGDVKSTKASMKKFESVFRFKFKKNIKAGIVEFIQWYKKFYKV